MTRSNKENILTKLKNRNLLSMQRQAIQPVDMLEPDEKNQTDEPIKRTERSNRTGKSVNRLSEPNARTEQANGTDERGERTVISELQKGVEEESKRATKRYSFEIFIDQVGSIEKLQDLYKKKTGKKVGASRILREALQEYLDRTLTTFREGEKE